MWPLASISGRMCSIEQELKEKPESMSTFSNHRGARACSDNVLEKYSTVLHNTLCRQVPGLSEDGNFCELFSLCNRGCFHFQYTALSFGD